MSQRVQNRVNAGLAALSATAVVAAPALAVTHAQVQAPEVLRSATAVQLAAATYKDNSDAELLGLTAQRLAGSIALTPVSLGVAAYSVAFGDQQTLADTLGSILDAPQYALDPTLELLSRHLPEPLGGTDGDPRTTGADEGQLQQFRAQVLLAARDTLKGYASSFSGKPINADDNPAAVLVNGAAKLGENAWTALTESPEKLSAFLTHVSKGDNAAVYSDIKDALEKPLTISTHLTPSVPSVDGSGKPSSAKLFGNLSNAVTNLDHGIETGLAAVLNVKIDPKTYDPVLAAPANKTNVVATPGAITPGPGISALNAKAQTPSQALSNVTKTFLPSKSARTQSLAGNETVKETGKGAGQDAGKGAGRHFSLGGHSRQAGDSKPSSPRHSVGKHRAAESGGR